MTHVIVAYWRPKDGQTGKIEEILRELAREIRREPGNLQFTVNRSRDNPDEFLLYEQYANEQAFLTINRHSISKLWSWNAPCHFSNDESATPIPFLTKAS